MIPENVPHCEGDGAEVGFHARSFFSLAQGQEWTQPTEGCRWKALMISAIVTDGRRVLVFSAPEGGAVFATAPKLSMRRGTCAAQSRRRLTASNQPASGGLPYF